MHPLMVVTGSSQNAIFTTMNPVIDSAIHFVSVTIHNKVFALKNTSFREMDRENRTKGCHCQVTETRTILPFDVSPSSSTFTWFVDRFVYSNVKFDPTRNNEREFNEMKKKICVLSHRGQCECEWSACLSAKSTVCTYWATEQSRASHEKCARARFIAVIFDRTVCKFW